MYNILICDDEKDIVNALKIYLENSEYNLIAAYDGQQAIDIVNSQEIHLILMDIMMPKVDGIKAMQEIRKEHNIPIILLTAKGEDIDKISGLNSGADDYITKPFNPMEVIARVKAQLRRYVLLGSAKVHTDYLIVGNIELDDKTKEVYVSGEKVLLTPTEYEILKLLMENVGRVFSPDQIYENVWNDLSFQTENTVAVHIRHIREKIEIDPANPRYIKVVWGQGYKMEDNNERK